MKFLLLAILISVIVVFIIHRCNNSAKESFKSKINIINEWNMNAMMYLCNVKTDSIPDKYSFVKFCDRMNKERDFKKFISLIIDLPSDYKNKKIKLDDFYFAPATRTEWLRIPDKKALGTTIAFYRNTPRECEKLAVDHQLAAAFNYDKKKGGCEIKSKKILVESKGIDVYVKEESIQYTISFWLKIKSLSKDREILSFENSKNRKIKTPSITVNNGLTSLKFKISTENNINEGLIIPTGYIPFKKWVHISFAVQGKIVKGFVNSRLVNSEKLNGYPLKNNNASDLKIIKSNGLEISKLRIIPVFVPNFFIRDVLINEDPVKGLSSAFHKTWDTQQSEYNQNGRNLQLLNKNQFPIHPYLHNKSRVDNLIDNEVNTSLDKFYRRPSYRIVGGIVYLSGMVGSVNNVGDLLILPIEARPDKTLYFNSGYNDNHVRLIINSNGYVEVGKNTSPNGKITLDTIRYPISSGAPLNYNLPTLVYFVKISKNGLLALSEIEIYDDTGKNIAIGKRITASSSKSRYPPTKAINGIKNKKSGGKWRYNKSMWVSNYQSENSITINLNGGYVITKIKLINTDLYNASVAGAKVSILDAFGIVIKSEVWDKNDFKKSNKLTTTLSKKKCQNWYSVSPHKSKYAPPVEISGNYGDTITEWIEVIDENEENEENEEVQKKLKPEKTFVPGFINSYTLKDIKGNTITKKGSKKSNGKDFKFSCKPGFITSYKFNNDRNRSNSDKNSMGMVTCSNGKTIKKYYGGGKEINLKKGQLLKTKDKKNTYFKPNKKWEFNDFREKGIGNHNYCRQTPTPDKQKGNFESTTTNMSFSSQALPTQDTGINVEPNDFEYDGNKRGEKLWCYTTDKNKEWDYCGEYDIKSRHTVAPPRNINFKFYKPEKEFIFNIAGTNRPSGFIGGRQSVGQSFEKDIDKNFREACWVKTKDMVYISGFVKLDPWDTINGKKIRSKRNNIPDKTYLAKLPGHVFPKSLKVFSCNLDDGTVRIHITKSGYIQLVDLDKMSIGYKERWISLDGINYSVNDKINMNLSKGYISFKPNNNKLLKYQTSKRGPEIFFNDKNCKSLNYAGVKITNHGLPESKKSSRKGLVSFSGILLVKSLNINKKIGMLEEDYRPNKMLNFYVYQNKKNNAMITITPQGDVKITGGNSKNEIKFISLDGISYFTNKSEQFLDDEISGGSSGGGGSGGEGSGGGGSGGGGSGGGSGGGGSGGSTKDPKCD